MNHVILMGGDARMRAAAAAFQDCHARCLWMADSPCPTGEALGAFLPSADVLLLPLPALTAEGRIRADCADCADCAQNAPAWTEIRKWLRSDCLVCGGALEAVDWPHKWDLLQDEQFAAANAVPTALAAGGIWGIYVDSDGRASMTRCGTVSVMRTPRSGNASAERLPPIRRAN